MGRRLREALTENHAVIADLAVALDERDRARAFAVTLEQENARVLHVLTTQVIPDADPTSAYLCGVRDGYQTATGFAIELLTEVPA